MNMTETGRATKAKVGKGTRGKLVDDLKTAVADVEELLKATAGQTGERIAAARAKAEESLKTAKVRLAEQGMQSLDGLTQVLTGEKSIFDFSEMTLKADSRTSEMVK